MGTVLPKNIDEIKKTFLQEIYQEKWYALFDRIKQGFSSELQVTPKSIQEKELHTFMIKFTYDTQKIEGSTLTLRETANLLEKGITPKEKPLRDIKEAEAHKTVFYEMLQCTKDLSLDLVLSWHKKLFDQTQGEIAGKIRTHGVAISGSKFLPPTPVEVGLLLTEFFAWYNHTKRKIHPVESAALAHLKFVTIHPLGDGNGRISRLTMNFVLHKHSYPLLDIPYENRNSYYHALERSQVKQNTSIFTQWFFRRYILENKKYLKQ